MDEIDEQLLKSVAAQLMTKEFVEVAGERLRVRTTSRNRLKTVQFPMKGQEYEAIEQNPEKLSRWGKLAREGHAVVQFRNLVSGKYDAVSVDGKLLVYGGKKSGRERRDSSDTSR
jgi:hypothetical protein